MQRDEQEIRELVSAWMTATKAADIDAVLSLMAEDVVFLLPGRPLMIGKAAFASAAKGHVGEEGPRFDGTSEIQDDPRRAHVVHPQEDRWKMAVGARCQHAGPPLAGSTPGS